MPPLTTITTNNNKPLMGCSTHEWAQTTVLRLQTIKAIVDSRSFKSPKSAEPRRVQVLDLYCLTRFESEGLSKEIVY